jgi:rubrerythrin
MSTTKSAGKSGKQSTKPGAMPGMKKTKVAAPKSGTAAKRTAAKAVAKAVPVTKAAAKAKAKAKAAPVVSASEFMAHAYAMEAEAAERYAEFADSMEAHNNREVAELFRKLSRIEQRHADQILEQMRWKQSPFSSANVRWEGAEGPETADSNELHYLMQPYHALQIALHNEKRARDFFTHLAKNTANAGVRKAALEMEQDEAEHVRLIEEWLKRTPVPDSNWETDQDPPVLSD